MDKFYDLMKKLYTKHPVLRYFWKKSLAKGAHNINKTRPSNVIECILVAFSLEIGVTELRDWQYNYGPTPAERTNYLEVPSVVYKVMFDVPFKDETPI